MKNINAIIVDEERLARINLVALMEWKNEKTVQIATPILPAYHNIN
jgi:hypothetical protein